MLSVLTKTTFRKGCAKILRNKSDDKIRKGYNEVENPSDKSDDKIRKGYNEVENPSDKSDDKIRKV